ncbi:hypothetical protein FRC07_003682 [Ceratobasidium sp. 392]|nr:hypothetical protein FRC07_003682 [Ceratobasidium sp. 392]
MAEQGPEDSQIQVSAFGSSSRQLKKEWLATQKIKAAYRAEKRRLGLKKIAPLAEDDAQDGSPVENASAAEAQSPDEHLSEHNPSDQSSIGGDYDSHPIMKHAETIRGREETDTARLKGKRKNKGKEKEKEAASTQPTPASSSLREMAREAYSPASLHTHKSNPLHRRQSGKDYARRRVETASTREGRTGPNGRGRGGGQPDMAKRMGVLLEKIKRAA